MILTLGREECFLKKQVVLVRYTFSDELGQYMRDRGYVCCKVYKYQNMFIMRCLRRIWYKLHLPFYSIWFDKEILKYSGKIVVFESLCSAAYLKWLAKHKKENDIVFWYWNIAKNTINPNSIDESWCKKWSFSRKDCKKYDMEFNPLPYFTEIKKPDVSPKYDIVFVGKDKGRLAALLELRDEFHRMGLTTNFVITPNNKYSWNPEYSKPVSYLTSVALAAEAKAVLDYIEVTDSGQSLRIVEALFLQEKIITNSMLVCDYDFYDPQNIFILGKDPMEKLPEFINTPYNPVPTEIVNRYDFDAIVDRFFDESQNYSSMMMDKLDG